MASQWKASIWSPATQKEKTERLIKLFVITRGAGFVAGSYREPSLPMTLAESGKAEDSASGAAPLPAGEPPPSPWGESVEWLSFQSCNL